MLSYCVEPSPIPNLTRKKWGILIRMNTSIYLINKKTCPNLLSIKRGEVYQSSDSELRSNVYIVPHATLPVFKLGKSDDVIRRLKEVSADNKWKEWKSSFNWAAGVRLFCDDPDHAMDTETSLKKLRFLYHAKAGGAGPRGVEWYKIEVLPRLISFVSRNFIDYEYDILNDLEALINEFESRCASGKIIPLDLSKYTPPFQSKYGPYWEVIRKARSERKTWQTIAAVLKADYGVEGASASSIFEFFKRQVATRRIPLGFPEDFREIRLKEQQESRRQ